MVISATLPMIPSVFPAAPWVEQLLIPTALMIAAEELFSSDLHLPGRER
jgi:hypothetical protein